jgi:5-formyltetrahydrofolate cyclo-ligase
LRRALRLLRSRIPPAARRRAAEAAARHLLRACRRWQARDVALYLGLREELDTAPLLRPAARFARLHVPKLAGQALRFARLRPRAALVRNRYGIREPAVLSRPARLDVIVLPLVAFDAAGRRLGMGGGYYDRLLARARPYRRPLRVGLAFAAQEVRAVPAARHDVRLDAVVTERGLRRFR